MCPVIRLLVWHIVSKTHFLSAIHSSCLMPAQHDATSREVMQRPYSPLVRTRPGCRHKIYVCHDYQPGGRPGFYGDSGEHRDGNIYVGQGIPEADFVAMRESRDATLAMPTLILPSLGHYARGPPHSPLDRLGRLFLKVPINAFGGPDVGPLAADS